MDLCLPFHFLLPTKEKSEHSMVNLERKNWACPSQFLSLSHDILPTLNWPYRVTTPESGRGKGKSQSGVDGLPMVTKLCLWLGE